MSKFNRYIVITILCFLMITAIVALAAPTTRAEADKEEPQSAQADEFIYSHVTIQEKEMRYARLAREAWRRSKPRGKAAPLLEVVPRENTALLRDVEIEDSGVSLLNAESNGFRADPEAWGEAATYLAKMAWGEARGCSMTGQAATMWCVLNRVDGGSAAGFRDTVQGVVTQPNQFLGYDPGNPVADDLYELALDVLGRWLTEKEGVEDVGRVLPSEYCWFTGNGEVNTFRDAYKGDCHTWDCSLPSPYDTEDAV